MKKNAGDQRDGDAGEEGKRPVEVEAVFGQLESNNRFNRFTFTGIDNVALEYLLMAVGQNLRKMVAKTKQDAKKAIASLLAPYHTCMLHLLALEIRPYHRTRPFHPKCAL